MEKTKQKEAKKTFRQFIQFNIVGISNTLVDFGVYFLLTKAFSVDAILAKAISFTAGIVNSYIWNTLWTFKKEKRRNAREILLFILVNVVSFGVNEGVFALCKEFVHIPHQFIDEVFDLCAASFCSAMVNFAGNKLFVFNKENPDNADDGKQEDETK